MAKVPKEGVPPERFAETTPPQNQDFSYLEIAMATQATLGKLSEAVDTLKVESGESRKKLDRISHIMYAVGVVGAILLAIGVFLLNKIADVVVAHFK